VTERGLVSARLARPQFHWGALDGMVTEAVSRLMGFDYEDAGGAVPVAGGAVPVAGGGGRGSDS
jgi:hypothetical protein